MDCAAGRRNLQSAVTEVPAARRKADFCLLFGGLQKVRRLTGRDPPVLPLTSISRTFYGNHSSSLPDLYTAIKPPLNSSGMIQPYKNTGSATKRPNW
jgi:hypothetical protein